MRHRAAGAALLVTLALGQLTRPALADDDEREGKKHFQIGVTLFQDGNYAGALAEFEVSAKKRPTASALQNIALCQKALFRYVDAVSTLEHLLAMYGKAMTAAEVKGVRTAIDAMRPLVVSAVLVVDPPEATVRVDGKPVPGGAERAVDVSIGPRLIEADAPLHRPFSRTISLSATDRRIEIKLTPDVGTLTINAGDPDATVMIDGVARGKGSWAGEVAGSVKHVVAVSKPGYLAQTGEIVVPAGERREMTLRLGPRDELPRPYTPEGAAPSTPTPVGTHDPRGPYAYVSATSYSIANQPDNYVVSKNDSPSLAGAYFGARAGYRMRKFLGLEAMFESGEQTVDKGTYTNTSASSGATDSGANYTLVGTRVGGGGRFFWGGDTWRFVGSGVLGGAYHSINIHYTSGGLPASTADSGWNGFFVLDAGAELELDHFLIDLVLAVAVDGVNKLHDNSGKLFYGGNSDITMGGIGLRVGYGLW